MFVYLFGPPPPPPPLSCINTHTQVTNRRHPRTNGRTFAPELLHRESYAVCTYYVLWTSINVTVLYPPPLSFSAVLLGLSMINLLQDMRCSLHASCVVSLLPSCVWTNTHRALPSILFHAESSFCGVCVWTTGPRRRLGH